MKYYRELTCGKEFKELFEQFSLGKTYLELDEFKKFMIEVQKAKDFSMIYSLMLFMEFCEDISKDLKEALEKVINYYNLLNVHDDE